MNAPFEKICYQILHEGRIESGYNIMFKSAQCVNVSSNYDFINENPIYNQTEISYDVLATCLQLCTTVSCDICIEC